MKKGMKKLNIFKQSSYKTLNPSTPQERRQMIKQAVERTVKEYGKALKKLGSE